MDPVSQLSQYNPNLKSEQQAANTASTNALNYQSAADQLPQQLKQAIMEKLNYNQDIISQQNQAQANYFAAPSQARNQYQDIFNPFQREALVNQATANAYAPYATLSQILANRQGSVADAINAGTGAFNSAVTAQQGNAQLAQNQYANDLGLAQWAYEQTHAKPTGGSGLGTDLSSLFEKLLGGGGGGQNVPLPTEPKPVVSPQLIQQMNSRPEVNFRSSGGQWMWDSQTNDWVPIVD